MPDYNPNRGAGEGPIRRPVRAPPVRRYGPGGLPTEGVDPAPKPWPIAPWLALIFIFGFLALQLYPETHFRHPKDPSRSWVPIVRNEAGIDHEATAQNAYMIWFRVGAANSEDSEIAKEVGDLQEIKSHEHLRGQISQDVEIYLSTHEKDLRPLAVVINSTITNARHPERIKFHLVIPSSESKVEVYKLRAVFPTASLEFIREGIDFEKISKLITYREDSEEQKDLATPYNFLLYYLPAVLKDKNIDKIIFLDTDVVVKGDIEELYRKGLEGYPVAAVKDCSQHLETYIDFKQLDEIHTRENGTNPWLPKEPFDPKACVFNRGALVMDVKKWIEQNVTEAIEWWMNEFNDDSKTLFKSGLSQPPFMLALYKNYKPLENVWNVGGLGRDEFSEQEMDLYAEIYQQRPPKTPFVSPDSEYAKILHFNGEFKPWKRTRARLQGQDVVSLCGDEGKECYRLWWEYLDKNAEADLI